MWYVCFLQLNNGDVYVGSTFDRRQSVEQHRQGQVKSTKAHLPISLKSYIAVATEQTARDLERCFKSDSGKAFANKRLW